MDENQQLATTLDEVFEIIRSETFKPDDVQLVTASLIRMVSERDMRISVLEDQLAVARAGQQ